jgi:putative MATE family efflux protein
MNSSTLNNPPHPTPPNKPVLWKSYRFFLTPMIVGNLIQSLSDTVNNIYLGQMIGLDAMASVSAFFPVLFILVASMIGLGSGAAVLIGQAWGANEHDRVRAIAGTTLMVGVIAGISAFFFGAEFAEFVLRLLNTPSDILPNSIAYARIMMMATPAIFVIYLISLMLRGVGDTKTPLYMLIISATLNMMLTPALIRGWFGLPQLGVASGAYSMGIACCIAIIWSFWYLARTTIPLKTTNSHELNSSFQNRCKHPFAPNALFLEHLRIDAAILRKIFKIALPASLSMITLSISEISVLFMVNDYGSQATAAFGAVNQIVNYVQFPAVSISIAATILGAQAIGAGRADILSKIAQTGIKMNWILTGSLVILALIFSRSIIGLFITDPVVVDIAKTQLNIMLWSNVIMGMSMVLSGLMRASGEVVMPTAITMFCILFIEIPTAWALSNAYGINGIWVAYPIAFLTMLAMQTAYYKLVWRKKLINRL